MATAFRDLDDASAADQLGLDLAAVSQALAVFLEVVALPASEGRRAEVLEVLAEGPGADIGPTYSAALIALGPVDRLAALTTVRGIGPKRLATVAKALASHTLDEVWDEAGLKRPDDGTGDGASTGDGSEGDGASVAALRADVAQLTALVAQLQADQAAMRAELDALRASGSPDDATPDDDAPTTESQPTTLTRSGAVGIEAIATSAGEQLHSAQTSLGTVRGLRLQNVELQIRGEAGATEQDQVGLRLGAPAAESQLSEIRLRYDGETKTTRRTDVVTDTVPTLTGYTEALARRKLAALGLEPDVQKAASDGGRRGTVVHQVPAGGAPLPSSRTVRVFLSL